MPHVIAIADRRHVLRDEVLIGRASGDVLLRALRGPDGEAIVLASGDATRDGAPMLGRLGVVPWGAGAVLRVDRVRIEVGWCGGTAPGRARPGDRCALCFGTLAPGEAAVVCDCTLTFHDDCNRARINCPGCGTPSDAEGRA